MRLRVVPSATILCVIPLSATLATSIFLRPNPATAQNVDSIKSCMNTVMYDNRFNPPRSTGISAEVAATACRNQTTNAPAAAASIRHRYIREAYPDL